MIVSNGLFHTWHSILRQSSAWFLVSDVTGRNVLCLGMIQLHMNVEEDKHGTYGWWKSSNSLWHGYLSKSSSHRYCHHFLGPFPFYCLFETLSGLTSTLHKRQLCLTHSSKGTDWGRGGQRCLVIAQYSLARVSAPQVSFWNWKKQGLKKKKTTWQVIGCSTCLSKSCLIGGLTIVEPLVDTLHSAAPKWYFGAYECDFMNPIRVHLLSETKTEQTMLSKLQQLSLPSFLKLD